MTDRRRSAGQLTAFALASVLLATAAACNDDSADPEPGGTRSSPAGPIGEPATDEATSLRPQVRRSVAGTAADFVDAARTGDCDEAWNLTDRSLVEQLGTRETFCETIASVPTTLDHGSLHTDGGLVWMRFPRGVQLAVTELRSSPAITPLPYLPSSEMFPLDPQTADGANREFLLRVQFAAAFAASDSAARPVVGGLPWIDARTGEVDLSDADVAQVDRWNNTLERRFPASVNDTVDTLTDPDTGDLPATLYP